MGSSLIHAYRIAVSCIEYKENLSSLSGFVSEKKNGIQSRHTRTRYSFLMLHN